MTRRSRLAVQLVCVLLAASPAAAQQLAHGQFDSGAYWRIQVPAGWAPADGLVVWNHGFNLKAPGPEPDLGPLAPLQLQQGYAVAASSYRQNGWALFHGIADLRDLLHEFQDRFGNPHRVYLTGGSLGGLVSVQGAEAAALDNMAGVYSLCGALGGGRLWDAALDLRLAYDAVCDGVSGASIPGGADGLPQRLDPRDYADDDLTRVLAAALGNQINRCTDALKDPGTRRPDRQQRLDRLMHLLGIPDEAFFLLNMAYATFGLADLVHDPGKLDGAAALGNAGVDYGDHDLNERIARHPIAPADRLRLSNNYDPTGELGRARMVALHTSGDGLVPVESLSHYAAKAPSGRLAAAVAQEDAPTHCGFSAAEVVAGWNALTDWVERDAPQPGAAQLQDACQSLSASGAHPGPCRLAPIDGLGSLDERVRPRGLPDMTVGEGISGAWFERKRDGEGWAIEVLDGDRALVYWFTYPPSGSPGDQRWFIGTGEVSGDRIRLDVLEPAGRPFDESSDEMDVSDWGELVFHFADCDSARVRWVGPRDYGVRQGDVIRLTDPMGCAGLAAASKDSPLPPPGGGVKGSWYDPAHEGSGLHLHELSGGRALVYWFTYDDLGLPAWILGIGELLGGSLAIDEAIVPRHARFGEDFDSGDVEPVSFGRMDIGFESCGEARLRFDSELAAFGSGERRLTRLTVPAGVDCPL